MEHSKNKKYEGRCRFSSKAGKTVCVPQLRWGTPSYYKLCLNYLICIKLIIHKKYLIRLICLNYLKFTVMEIKHFIQFKHYIGLNLTWR